MSEPIKLFPFNSDKTYLFSPGSSVVLDGKKLGDYVKGEKLSPLSHKYGDRELPFIVTASVGKGDVLVDSGADRFYYVLESNGGTVTNGFSSKAIGALCNGKNTDIGLYNEYPVKNGDFCTVTQNTPFAIGKGVSYLEVYPSSSALIAPKEADLRILASKAKDAPLLKKPAFRSEHDGFSVRVLSATASFTCALITVAGEYTNKISAVGFAFLFVLDGACEFKYSGGKKKLGSGESYLLCSDLGEYSVSGPCEFILVTK